MDLHSNFNLFTKYEELLIFHEKEDSRNTSEERLKELRRLILTYGLPKVDIDQNLTLQDINSLRTLLWELFLNIHEFNPTYYISLIKLGPSKYDKEIRNDSFRTFKNDMHYLRLVPEEKLIRVLNAFLQEKDESTPFQRRYIQGMTVLCAPFLYLMSEIEAFYAFRQLITIYCPTYMVTGLLGAHEGCHLMDAMLQHLDNELYTHLCTFGTNASIYAFPWILSFLASCPPLTELICLWDTMLAMGPYFNLFLCVAQLWLLRDKLLACQSTQTIMQILQLRSLPLLSATKLCSLACKIIYLLPDTLLEKIILHTTGKITEKPEICQEIINRTRKGSQQR